MYQFNKNNQAFGVINGTCGSVPKGNWRGKKEAIDWQKENHPLPKRKRLRKSVSSDNNQSSKLESSTSDVPCDDGPKCKQDKPGSSVPCDECNQDESDSSVM